MPIRTETYDLAEEYDDLTERIDTLADDLDKYDADTPHFEQAAATRDELQRRLHGLERFADVYPDATEVTLGELSPAEYAALESHLPDGYGQQEYRTVMTAVATVDAPYLADGVEATIQTVLDEVPAYFTRWATTKADDLLRPEDVGENPFSGRETTGTEDE